MIALTAAVYFFRIPNPNMILIAGLTVCTTLYGYIPGILCGAEMIGYSLYFFSVGHSFVNFTSENLLKVMIITIGAKLLAGVHWITDIIGAIILGSAIVNAFWDSVE